MQTLVSAEPRSPQRRRKIREAAGSSYSPLCVLLQLPCMCTIGKGLSAHIYIVKLSSNFNCLISRGEEPAAQAKDKRGGQLIFTSLCSPPVVLYTDILFAGQYIVTLSSKFNCLICRSLQAADIRGQLKFTSQRGPLSSCSCVFSFIWAQQFRVKECVPRLSSKLEL